MVNIELGKIHLGQVAGFGLKTHLSHLLMAVFNLSNPSFDNLIAAEKPHIDQPVIDPSGCVAIVFFNPGLNIIDIRIELAFPMP